MTTKSRKETIEKAREFRFNHWIDASGKQLEKPIRLSNYMGKYKIIYCFQHWCPGCHKIGLPSLKKMVDALQDSEDIAFLAVQTVFEGHDQNTKEKIVQVQKEYNLAIPFGHDDGLESGSGVSTIMADYNTGGTPWFILIDKNDHIVFSDFHINTDVAIDYLKKM